MSGNPPDARQLNPVGDPAAGVAEGACTAGRWQSFLMGLMTSRVRSLMKPPGTTLARFRLSPATSGMCTGSSVSISRVPVRSGVRRELPAFRNGES